MSYWLVSVPVRKAGGGAGMVSDLATAAGHMARVAPFDLPPLKVGTLDQLMALRSATRGEGEHNGVAHGGCNVAM